MADPAAPDQSESTTDDVALYCPSCMYDLRGLAGDACPECGAMLDREKLAQSAIPWVHREGLGIGAFLKTAWLATFKTQLFCLEVARPVSLKDARKFRQQVAALLTIVVLIVAGGYLIVAEEVRDPMEQLFQSHPMLAVLLVALPVIPVSLFMLAFTGVHTYWFHPKALSVEQQNRAVAISHYACAPLLWLAPALVVFGIANLIGVIGDAYEIDPIVWMAVAILLVAFVAALLSLIAYLFVCARMARHAANRSGPARLTIWLGLPSLWLGLIALIFFVVPLAGFYLYFVITSF